MDRIPQNHHRGIDVQLRHLRAGGDDVAEPRRLSESQVRDIRAALDEGLVDRIQIARLLVEAGRTGDVYAVAKDCDQDCDHAGPGKEGRARRHDPKLAEALLTTLAVNQIEAVQQEVNASLDQIFEENRERDIVATRVVGDRLVFDTANGPAHSMALSSAELARLERGAAPPKTYALEA